MTPNFKAGVLLLLCLSAAVLPCCSVQPPGCEGEACQADPFCRGADCVECLEDKDCSGGEVCIEGTCQESVECIEDTDCNRGENCIEGECQYPEPEIMTSELPSGAVQTPYEFALESSGGKPPLTWSLSSGDLPSGLELTPDGVLAGTPIQAQTKKFSVTLKDDAGETFARNFSLQIFADNAVHITTQTLKAAKEGIPYSFQLTAQGGTEPYAWQILSGALPKGLTLSSTGDISGTSTEIGSFPLEIRVFDASTPPSFESKGFTLESQMAPLEIVGTMVFDLLVSKLVVLSPLIPYFPYAANLEARGGLKPYSWSQEPPPPVLNLFIQKWGLPKGLKMTQAGRISGSVTNTSDATTITIPGGPSLSGYFFMGKVSDSRSPSRSTSAIFCIPTIAL